MWKTAAVVILILMVGTVANAESAADLVLMSGRVVTVNAEFEVVEALAIRNGRVLAAGSNDRIQQFITPATKVIDLKGRMVLPGLIDSHTHPTSAAQFEADHDIPTFETIAEVLDYVKKRTRVVPKGEWIGLSQVFITRLREQRYPTRAELDSVAPEHPVVFRTGPDGSANSLALAENGIDKEFAAKHPENVMTDPATGEPNGILRRLSSVLKSKSNSVGKRLTSAERDQRLVDLFTDYNRSGITGVIDRNCSDSAREQYERLLQADRLTVRVRMSRGLSPNGKVEEIEKRLDEFVSDPLFEEPHPMLGLIGVKVFQDGGMLTGSAFFRRPWGVSTIYGIEDPAYRGMRYIEQARLETLVRACVKRGLAFTAHCQGDAAVEALVAAYETVNVDIPIAPTHSTVTHSSFMSRQAIETAAKLGVGVDLQPAWLYLDARTLVQQFGDERLEYFIPLRSLFEAGVIAGGGSDHMQKIGSLRSVNPYHPFLGMWIAVTRTARWHDTPIHPEQALSREQMIRFYTSNNAWLMRAEAELGSLEPGKRADFIIIDRDLLTCSANAIKDTQVEQTWLDGQKIYDRDTQ